MNKSDAVLPVDDDVFLTPRQTADILTQSTATLAKYRQSGNHPLKFIRLSRQKCLYRAGDVRQYLQDRTVAPTSDKTAPAATQRARSKLSRKRAPRAGRRA